MGKIINKYLRSVLFVLYRLSAGICRKVGGGQNEGNHPVRAGYFQL